MIATALPGFLAASLALALSVPSSAVGLDAAARGKVESLIRLSAAEVAVAFRTLDGRDEFFLRDAESFHAASTMKIP